MPENFVSDKRGSVEDSLREAKKLSTEEKTIYTVIQCFKSKGFYVVQGDGGMIRGFETIVVQYENGKKIN